MALREEKRLRKERGAPQTGGESGRSKAGASASSEGAPQVTAEPEFPTRQDAMREPFDHGARGVFEARAPRQAMPADKPPRAPQVPEARRQQKAHGAQSDQGGPPLKEGPRAEPDVYEGAEESNQQRRS